MGRTERLVLFDIDGTILDGGKLWRECFEHAVARCFAGVEFGHVPFDGKTDRQICLEYFESAGLGLGPEDTERATDQVLDAYLSQAGRYLETRAHEVRELPGARALIERLSGASDVGLALLTGNVERGARLKLGALDLAHPFVFGVYGDDHWNRYELPAIAVGRARERLGREFSGKQIVIIGDTIHDVNCGKSIGVRSIAVGTGKQGSKDSLLAAGPDFYFPDLSDTDTVIDAILSEITVQSPRNA